MSKCFEFRKCFTDEIRIFTFCDHSDRARKSAVKRKDRKGWVAFKFKFT
jgi:hypothetical protein